MKYMKSGNQWSNRTRAFGLTLAMMLLLLAGCSSTHALEASEGKSRMFYAYVNSSVLPILAADNSSTDAFLDLLKTGDVTIDMHDYGSFEKVGPLGTILPRNDEQITTEPGDVILYQGNQITIYYDVNSWTFTRLGKVQDLSKEELKKILGHGNVAVTFSLKYPDIVQKNLSDADITVMDARYTGSALKPAVEVILDGDLLDEGTDYTVFYSNNVNAGKGTVKITGKGDYTGSAKATFTISPASISGASISGVKDKVYTGKNLTQAITVKVGSKKLKSGTDYSESYANNKNVGTATLTIKGKGNYTGTATANFKILPKATGISNIVPGKKSFTAEWKKQANQSNGYIIQYSTDKNFKKDVKNKKITNANTTKATISGLSGNRTYYVRICTFKLVNGKTYSSTWSKSKTVKTKN